MIDYIELLNLLKTILNQPIKEDILLGKELISVTKETLKKNSNLHSINYCDISLLMFLLIIIITYFKFEEI